MVPTTHSLPVMNARCSLPSSEVHRASAPTEVLFTGWREAFGTSSVAGVEPIALLRCRFAKLADDYSVELLRRFAAVREEKALTALSSD